VTGRDEPPPVDGPGDLTVRVGSAKMPGYAAGWRSALDELSTAQFDIDLEEASGPVDYLGGAEIAIDGHKTWEGTVVEAEPRGAKVHVEGTDGVSMTEQLMGAMGSEECPVMDVAYAIARSSGFAEENIVISHLDELPLETMEVVVAVKGVEVPGRRRIGPVTLVPAAHGMEVLGSFEIGRLGETLVDAIEAASCFAVVVKTLNRLWDAEQAALADVDAVLGWLAVRARFGLAHLPDGTRQRYSREVTRTLPRRGDAMAIRGLATGRRWIRDPATLVDRPLLSLEDHGGLLSPALTAEIESTDRLALLAASRAFDGDPIQRIVALWEAWELYAGAASSAPVFSTEELGRLGEDLPGWLSERQAKRVSELLQLANNQPLSRVLRAALEDDGVPVAKEEWKALWRLRRVRNRSVHGADSRKLEIRDLELSCSLLSRALVFRLGRGTEALLTPTAADSP
jgi:hypothetical protein